MISLDPSLLHYSLAAPPKESSLEDWQISCHYNCIQIAARDDQGRSWLSTGNYFRQNLLSYLLYSVAEPSAGEKVLEEIADHEPWEAARVLSEGLEPEFGAFPQRNMDEMVTPRLLERLLQSEDRQTRRLALKASRIYQGGTTR